MLYILIGFVFIVTFVIVFVLLEKKSINKHKKNQHYETGNKKKLQ